MIKFTLTTQLPKQKDIALVSFSDEKESVVIMLPGGQKSIRLGILEKEKINRRKLVLLIRQTVALAKSHQIKRLAFLLDDFVFPSFETTSRVLAELLAVNCEMANFEFIKYKTRPKEGWNFLEEVIVVSKKATANIKQGLKIGALIGGEVNACRVLVNTPAGEMTPQILAYAAGKAVRGTSVKTTVLGQTEIERLRMGGVLGVSRGSAEEPCFIILEYWGGEAKEKPIVLVGKGVTFDTGGLNLKPTEGIYEMHMDMSGAAAVIHAIAASAKLKLNKNIVGLIPAVENMPSGSSYHPGDVLRTMSGKTIEVLNTDAEGRIILADALLYAKRYRPGLLVDVATLTSAAIMALGQRASAIFSTEEDLQKLICELGEESGDYVWPMPLWEEYEEDIKGTFGDVANTGKTRYGGAITAAMFLKQFIGSFPWVHIDIAPRMTSIEGEHLAKGAAGAPVRLLVKLLERI